MASPTRLEPHQQRALAAPDNPVFVSSVTVWEIAIKRALGRITFPLEQFDDLAVRMGFGILPILPAHAIAAGALPRHHADPFDRMLIAQAQLEGLTIVTRDPSFESYSVATLAA
jgi:PIN domain nuclease of toxin-antitoxin system